MVEEFHSPYEMAFGGLFKKQPARAVVVQATLFLAVVGTVDYVTGWELSVSLFYALIILMVALRVDRNTALVFAVSSGAIWCVANFQVHPYKSQWAYAWATFTRLAYFVFVAVGGASFRAYQESNRKHIEALERARDLEHEIARVSEREQRRIGQDLHDSVCQSLAAIQFATSVVREDLGKEKPEQAAALQDISKMVKDAIAETRDLARGIFPVQMEEVGLAAVLDDLVTTTKRLRRIDATFEMQGDVKVSDPEVAMHLYRIAQEALNNALKHGQPTKLAVSLIEKEGVLRLTVSDDGAGLSAPQSPHEGMGLKTMRHRANLIGAQLDIRNHPTSGVSVVCSLPTPSIPHSCLS